MPNRIRRKGWTTEKGYRRLRVGKRQVYFHKLKYESRFGLLLPGFELHHADENKRNNSFENLKPIWKPEHSRLHNPKGVKREKCTID